MQFIVKKSCYLTCLFVVVSSALLTAQIGRAGRLDTTFGSGGVFTTNLGATTGATSVALQSTGKIIIGGNSGSGGALARINSNGTLDTTFGSGGFVTSRFGISGASVVGLAVQSDDKILAIALGFPNDLVLGRFNSNGSVDTSFGNQGFTSTLGPCQVGFAAAIALQSNGDTLVGCGFKISRFTSTGQFDTSFGSGGTAPLKVAGPNVNAISAQSDGRILVASSDIGFEGMVSRYNADGSVDTSYGILGQSSSISPTNALVLQGNGQSVIAGNLITTLNPAANGFGLIRFNTNGGIDTTFGSQGGVATGFPGLSNAIALAAALQTNGELIAAGEAFNQQSASQFALARYLSGGGLDITFGVGGRVLTSFSSPASIAAMVLQSDGKIVVAGTIGTSAAVARYFAQ